MTVQQSKSLQIERPEGDSGFAWLFGSRASAEEQERLARETKVRDLLPDE